jgi:DNA polymerase-3 subunit delta'
MGRDEEDPELISAAALAEGSVRRALTLLAGDTLDLRKQIVALLARLPDIDRQALHALGDRLYGTEPATLEAFVDVVNGWLAERLRNPRQQRTMLDRLARIWTEFNQSSRDTETFNLDRKPLVFNVFMALADASRAC